MGLSKVKRTVLVALGASSFLVSTAVPALAHVSIYNELTGTMTSITGDSLKQNASGTLYFRPGHGCTDETATTNPLTGLSMAGTGWGTHAFSVKVPAVAAGKSTVGAGTAYPPKPLYLPGWKSKVVANNDGSYTVTWTAINGDFDLPFYAADDASDHSDGSLGGSTMWANFGIKMKWGSDVSTFSDPLDTAAVAGRVYFESTQVCPVDMNVASPSPGDLTLTQSAAGKYTLALAADAANASKRVNVEANGVLLSKRFTNMKLSGKGAFSLGLTTAEASKAKAAGAYLTVSQTSDAAVLAWTGGTKRNLYINWSQHLAAYTATYSQTGSVANDTEVNVSPSVLVHS